jgi:hypothetical protein
MCKKDRPFEIVESLEVFKRLEYQVEPAQCFIAGEIGGRENFQVLYNPDTDKYWVFDESLGSAELLSAEEIENGEIGEAIKQEQFGIYC